MTDCEVEHEWAIYSMAIELPEAIPKVAVRIFLWMVSMEDFFSTRMDGRENLHCETWFPPTH